MYCNSSAVTCVQNQLPDADVSIALPHLVGFFTFCEVLLFTQT